MFNKIFQAFYVIFLFPVSNFSLFSGEVTFETKSVVNQSGVALPQDRGSVYTNPGIIALRNGKWAGSDHLYNLSNNIGIVVEITKPPEKVVPIDEAFVRNIVLEVFKKARISAQDNALSSPSPLPFMHVLIMIAPVQDGFVALCAGRLFEEIQLERIHLDQGIMWQGITWERQELVVASKEELLDHVEKVIGEIASAFTERYQSSNRKN